MVPSNYDGIHGMPSRHNDAQCKCLPCSSSALDNLHSSAEWRELQDERLPPLAAKLKPILGKEEIDVGLLFDCFWTHFCPDVGTIPSGLTDGVAGSRVIDEVVNFVQLEQGLMFNNPEVIKFGIGPLLHDILASMTSAARQVARGSLPETRIALYSGHDTGPMMPMLGALGIFNEPYQFTPYASMLILELLQHKDGRIYVRVIYNGQVQRVPFDGCAEVDGNYVCPWEVFQRGLHF